MIIKLFSLTLMLFGMSSCGKHIDYVQSYYQNQKFKYYLGKKEFEKAQAAELASKENLQDHFELDSNLGVVFNLLSKNDQAEKSFDEALKLVPQQFFNVADRNSAFFTIYFNRGVFFQSQKNVDSSLKEYQMALDLNPTSKEIKTNIELMIQRQKQDKKDQDKKDGEDKKPGKDEKPQDKPGDEKKDGQSGEQKEPPKKEGQDRKQNAKYQPRPFKGDQLSEGDVKKILSELSQQDKKIRSQFNKKDNNESGVERKNEKDW